MPRAARRVCDAFAALSARLPPVSPRSCVLMVVAYALVPVSCGVFAGRLSGLCARGDTWACTVLPVVGTAAAVTLLGWLAICQARRGGAAPRVALSWGAVAIALWLAVQARGTEPWPLIAGALVAWIAAERPLRRAWWLAILVAVGVVVAYGTAVGSYAVARDGFVVVAAALLVAAAIRRGTKPFARDRPWTAVAGFLLTAWLFTSVADRVWSARPIRRPSPGDVQPANQAGVGAGRWPGVRVGLALSGGGYRAALVHAGVVDGLAEMGVPVTALSTVSGGSIFGAFLATGGRPREFADAVAAGRFNMLRELTGAAAIPALLGSIEIPLTTSRLVIGPLASRTRRQADLLDRRFLDGVVMRALPPGHPALMVATTDITSGALVGVTPYGIVVRPLASGRERTTFVNGEHDWLPRPHFAPRDSAGLPGAERASLFVAASGAFPGAFDAVRLPVRPGAGLRVGVVDTAALVDGGVGDNYGTVLLRTAAALARRAMGTRPASAGRRSSPIAAPWSPDTLLSPWNVDLILAADASALPDREPPPRGISEFVRAMEIVALSTGGNAPPFDADFSDAPADSAVEPLPAVVLTPTAFVGPFDRLEVARAPGLFVEDQNDIARIFTQVQDSIRALHPGLPDLGRLLARKPGGDSAHTAFPFALSRSGQDTLLAHLDPGLRTCGRAVASAVRAGGAESPTRGRSTVDGADAACQQLVRQLGGPKPALDRLLNIELGDRLRAFALTPTLADHPPPARVESLFLLGKYLVLLNEAVIRGRLDQLRTLAGGPARRATGAVSDNREPTQPGKVGKFGPLTRLSRTLRR